MRDAVMRLWPELEWILDASLREATARTWERALAESPLTQRTSRRSRSRCWCPTAR